MLSHCRRNVKVRARFQTALNLKRWLIICSLAVGFCCKEGVSV